MPSGRTVLGAPSAPRTPAPPGLIELREVEEPSLAEAPDTAPAPPVLPRLYENVGALPEAPSAAQDRSTAALEFIALLETQVASTKERSRQGRLHYEWARLLEAPLADFAGALEHLKKAHELAPEHEGVVAALRRVHLLLGQHEAALPWFDLEAKQSGPPETKAALFYEKGVLLEGPLARPADARKAYETAHELSPHDAGILRAVSRARRRDKAWKDVERALELQAQGASADPAIRAARLAERARIVEVRRKDTKAAAGFFELSFAASSDLTSALADLERVHALARHDKDWAETLEARVRLAGDPRVRASALVLLARIRDARLGDPALAADAYERAYAETPTETGILEELVRLYERTGQLDRSIAALARLEESRTDPVEKAELRLRLGHAQLAAGDLIAAGLEFERARSLDPLHPGVIEALVRFYTERENWDLLIQVHAGVAHAARDAQRRADAHRTIAELHEAKLGQKDAAVLHHQKALGLVPGYAASFRSLARLFSELGRKTDLLELYERGVELAKDDETAFAYLFKMGRLLEDDLRDPGRAIEIYRRVLARSPSHLGALLALERAAEHARDFPTLVDALEKEAALREQSEKVALLHRAGDVAALELGDDARAQTLYKAVQKLDPRFAPVLTSLRRLHGNAGRFAELLDVYTKELVLEKEPGKKAQLHFLIGQLLETKLGRGDQATLEYKKALEQDPLHASASRALGYRLVESGQFDELAQILAREAEHEKDAEKKARLLSRLADIQETRLDKPAEALKSFEAASKASGALRVALEGRIRLHAALGQSKELVRALDEDAEAATDPFTRISARLRAAEVLRDDLNQLAEAAERYELVLVDRPGHTEALLALEGLYAELGRTEELDVVLREQVRTFERPDHQIAALRELVRTAPNDAERKAALAALLERAPGDLRALDRVALAALRDGSVDELARADARLAEHEERKLVAAAHHTRLGEYLERKNAVQALLAYKNALARDPDNLAATRGTSRLAELIGDPQLLLEAAEGEVKVTRDPEHAARLFVRAAQRLREENKIPEAMTALERALLVYPDDARAAADLIALGTAQREFDRLVTVLSDAAGRSSSKDVRADHWIAVARVHANSRGDLPAALTALLRVEKSEPNHARTLLELGELYVKNRQFDEATKRLERALAGDLTPAERSSVRLRLGELYHEHLDRPAEATAVLEAVLVDEPLHKDALRRLLRLQMAGKSGQARETARAWVEAAEGPERAEALTTWGRLARDAGELEEARTAFEQAVALVGVGAPGAAADLTQLLRDHSRLGRQGGFESFTRTLEGFVMRAGDSPLGAAASLELGRLYLDEMNDPARGLPALERGLRATPRDVSLRVEYVTRLRSAGQNERALDELLALLALDPARLDSWRDLVEIFERLGRNGEAHLALGPLVLLGGGSELQKAIWRERKPRPALVPEASFSGDALEFTSARTPGEAIALLSQLADLAHKLYGPGWERIGIAPRERTGPRSGHPLRPLFDRVVRAFGPVDVDLYVASDYDGPMRLVLTDPVGIVVPASFVGLPEPDQVFVLGRFVAQVARGTHLAEFLGPDEFRDLIVAAVRLVDPRFGSSKTSGSELDALSRRIAKALPWLAKGRFEETARNYAEAHPTGFVPAPESLVHAALLTALVLADDIAPTALLSRAEGSIAGVTADQKRSTQLALLEGWVSEGSMQLRRRAGLA